MSNEVSNLIHQLAYSEPVQKVVSLTYKARRLFLAIPLCLLLLYVFVSLLSYSPMDNAWSRVQGFDIASQDVGVANAGGVVGAWLADFLHLFFGVGAWAFLLWLVHEIYGVVVKKTMGFALRWSSYLFLWACLDILIYAYAISDGTSQAIRLAGITGHECYLALSFVVGHWGAILFALVGFGVVSVLLVDWRRLYAWAVFKLSGMELPVNVPQHSTDAPKSKSKSKSKPIAGGAFEYQAGQTTAKPSAVYDDIVTQTKPAQESSGMGVLASFLTKSGLRDVIKQDKTQPIGTEPVDLPEQFEEVVAPPAPARPKAEPSAPKKKRVKLLTDYGDGLVSERVIPEKSVMLNGKLKGTQKGTQKPIKTEPPTQETFDSASFVNLSLNGKQGLAPTIMQGGVFVMGESTPEQASAVPPTKPASPTIIQSPIQPLFDEQKSVVQGFTPVSGTTPLSAVPVSVPPPVAQQAVVNPQTASPTIANQDAVNTTNVSVAQPAQTEPNPKHSLGGALFQKSGEVHWRDILPNNFSQTQGVIASESLGDAKVASTAQADLPVSAPNPTASNPTPTPTLQTVESVASAPMPTPAPTDLGDETAFAGFDLFKKKPNATVKPAPATPPAPQKPVRADSDNAPSYAMQMAEYRKNLSPIPSMDLLDPPIPNQVRYSDEQLLQLAELLEIKLKEFNVNAKVMNVLQGPIVTNFEVQLAAGVKASKVTGIAQDLARSLAMPSLRVVEVIAGKPYIGIEIPNQHKQTVKLIELLKTPQYQSDEMQIAMAMGKDISGNVVIADLAKAPHMLVAGTTGSGKSVLVNAMLVSMLLKYTPEQLRLILIDPKMLELAPYDDIPHLLTPVVTDMNEAASALSWCVGEMERRYHLMSLLKVRKLSEFNKKIAEAELNGTPILDPLWRPTDSMATTAPKLKPLPLIVVVADEFADMIMQVGRPAEELITRLAQKSRASGIHLMLATQRPSADIITGLIRSNIPSRVALRVNNKVDSRIILDESGAENMLGHGDMLFLTPSQPDPVRVHGAYVSDEEVNRITDAWRERGSPNYIETVASTSFDLGESRTGNNGEDVLYDEAVTLVLQTGKTSISSLQQELSIGYNRAAKIINAMERNGVLSSADSKGKRTIL